MTSLLNPDRPPAFCPGCSHDQVVKALDLAFQQMGLEGSQIAIVSDIGCCGLFDTFFQTHAFHGLHGRALTYATGLKLARPQLNVITVMGDGGLGIGGAHVLSACRRNLDITLLVLNNFNYGMTGGQCSATTPEDAQTASGFLNRMEKPLDICHLAEAAGAPYATRLDAAQKDLPAALEGAIAYPGFAVVDIWGLCTGRYLKRNQKARDQTRQVTSGLPAAGGVIAHNVREEYGRHYMRSAKAQSAPPPMRALDARLEPAFSGRREVLLLGAAGQRINTAGEMLCLAALASGLHAAQKNDYPITVLRGHSISEVVLSNRPIGYIGILRPSVVVAVSPEGVARREAFFSSLDADACVIKAKGLSLPVTPAAVVSVDFKAHAVKRPDWALAALTVLAYMGRIITPEMLAAAIKARLVGKQRDRAVDLMGRFMTGQDAPDPYPEI